MRCILLLISVFLLITKNGVASENTHPRNLISPTGTETDSTLTILWDKPLVYKDVIKYHIYLNNKMVGTSTRTNFRIKNLKPQKKYAVYIIAEKNNGSLSGKSNILKVRTRKKSNIFNILDFGAIGDGKTLNTKAIQNAIDACSSGGTVYIPSDTFLSGPLFLKSNLTLYVAKGGVLQGSSEYNVYYPLLKTRFEGWEVMSFASLLNAGKLDNKGPANVKNLSIRGEGTIQGGGGQMGREMRAKEGLRSRARLICLMNCENVDIQGLHIDNPPSWCIHYTYCKNVVLHDLTITSTADNGDGIDPDSSIDSYIFNCWFSTGDDCIAIKSGKNPEGNIIDKPTLNVRITDCVFEKGHSLAIGSEIAGGVRNVLVMDCKIGNLDNGFRIKTNKFRGGFIEDVTVRDCDLLKILVTTRYNPNNDGEAAKEITEVRNINFLNLNLTQANVNKPVIEILGFDAPEYYFQNLNFTDIKLPENGKISMKYSKKVNFKNVFIGETQNKPLYEVSNCEHVVY